MKAFIVNRVGDFGFILGIGLVAAYGATLNYARPSPGARTGQLTFPGTTGSDHGACICLFIGANARARNSRLHV